VVPDQYANRGQCCRRFGPNRRSGCEGRLGRITTTVSAFDITKPLQLVDLASNTLTQAGQSRNRGVELNAFGEVTPGVRLLGGVMFIDARQEKNSRQDV